MPEPKSSEGKDPMARLAKEGVIVPAKRSWSDALDQRGPLTGPVSNAGTQALAETRAERG